MNEDKNIITLICLSMGFVMYVILRFIHPFLKRKRSIKGQAINIDKNARNNVRSFE